MSEGDHFTTFYLSSGYRCFEIHPEHRGFLGFEWTFEDGSTKHFQFCVLPFGMSSACYVFTRVLRPFAKRWGAIGVKAINYIDDGVATSSGFELAKTAGKLVGNDLVSAGFVIDSRKRDFDPKAKGKWLGTMIDTIEMTFTVPSERINGLLADIKNSSAHKELLAIKCVLDCFGGVLQSQSVQVRVDDSSACRILSVGSAKSLSTEYCY